MIIFSGSGSKQVILRSAAFGDGYRVHLGLNCKRAMDSTPFCTVQTSERKVHFFSVNGLNTPKRQELEAFIKATANELILIRFEYPEEDAREIKARLVTQPFETTHQGSRNTIATFEYEEQST